MKWLKGFLGVLYLAGVMCVVGCGEEGTTELEATGEGPAVEGHEGGMEEMEKEDAGDGAEGPTE